MAMNDLSAHERNVAAVVRKAEESLGTILDESGTILYSSCATLKPGKYYFLGLNPGGTDANTKTIRESLGNLGARTDCAYLDEDWGSDSRSYGPQCHPLQKNFKGLFEALGEDPRAVCASNLIFSRSIGEKGAGGIERAKLCWPVHETILEIVHPAAIITFGRQPFNFIIDKLSGTAPNDFRAGHGKWTWRYSTLKTGEKLIGFPHLSRYALTSHPDVLHQIRELIG
jgi:hypothetical protein